MNMSTVNKFKALSDEFRLLIFTTILANNGLYSVNEIAQELNCEQTRISKSVRILKDTELINFKRIGREVHYFVNNECMFCDTIIKYFTKRPN